MHAGNKYFCSVCNRHTEATRSVGIEKQPQILTLHLNRTAGGSSKIRSHMQAPFALNLGRWCETTEGNVDPAGGCGDGGVDGASLPSSPVSPGGPSTSSASSLPKQGKANALYDLIAIVFHTGHTANSGHYVCATAAGPRSPPKYGSTAGRGKQTGWLMFDDTAVKRLSAATIQKMLAPDCKSASTAYMLFYSRRTT